MRILYILNHLAEGGAATVTLEWLRYLHQTDHQIEVCTIYAKGRLAGELEQLGIPIHDLNLSPGFTSGNPQRKYDPRAILMLASLIRRGHYDVVHVQNFPASLLSACASLLAPGACYVFTEHNAFNHRREHRIFKLLDRFIYSRYQAITGVSQSVIDELVKWLPATANKTVTIPNGIDPRRFKIEDAAARSQIRASLGLTPDQTAILFGGRFEYVKGLDLLIASLAQVKSDRASYRVLLAGDGKLQAEVREQVRQANLEDVVSFLGFRSDMDRLLSVVDVVVLPSRWEGLPMILLEAMAAGRAVVATSVGGTPEIVVHQKTGLLVAPEDAAALARELDRVIESPDLRQQLGQSAFATISEAYSIQRCGRQLLDVYSACAAPSFST